MKISLLALLIGSSSLLWTSCSGPVGHSAGPGASPVATPTAATPTAPLVSAAVTHGEAEQALFSALNAARQKAGQPALRLSPELARLARSETATAAAAGSALALDDTNAVRDISGFPSTGKLVGQLTDRGPRTGTSFVDYWVKQNPGMIEDGWTAAGVGISRTPKGQLLAVVLFGGPVTTGGGLMQPMR